MSEFVESPAQKEKRQRALIVAEALSWVGTPYVPGAGVKGAGIDCGMLLIEIFKACGHIPPEFDPRPYPIQWHFHQAAERYLGHVEQFAWRRLNVDRGEPGDIVMFKFGKCFSHGAVITEWPTVIHAMRPRPVGPIDVLKTQKMAKLERRFYTVWP